MSPDPSQQKLITFFTKRKRMPSFRELSELLGFSSPNAAQRIVSKWITEKFITKDDNGKMIPGDNWPSDTTELEIPLLGSVQAGFPTHAEEESETVSISGWLLGEKQNKRNCFMLRVSGDSMIDAGIHPGDMVIITRGTTPKNGDIVVAEVDNEWTLKYYQNAKGNITLFPANKAYPPIIAKRELNFAGVVKAVMRRY
jgi:repressor LexA